jgi:asparagine synthase (glutamine-hydrolysing)
MDQPSTDGFNTWLVSRAAAGDVKGVLSGLGGDEWFAGYPVTRRMARCSASIVGQAEAWAGRIASVVAAAIPEGYLRERVENLAARRSMLDTWMHGHTVFRRRHAASLAMMPEAATNASSELEAALAAAAANWRDETPVGLSCLLDHRIYMGSQLLRDSDATSMAHSLELRVPLVDVDIAAFSRSCTDAYKLDPRGGSGDAYSGSGAKRVLIQALRSILPKGLEHTAKRGFALPMDVWLRGDLTSLVDECCQPDTVSERGLLEPNAVRQIHQRWRSGQERNGYPKLWSLVIFELWCRAVLDTPAASSYQDGAVALAS